MQTDLALEIRESFEGDGGEISGVALKKEDFFDGQIQVTQVDILNERGAQKMQKPVGTYITVETVWLGQQSRKTSCVEVVLDCLRKLVPANCQHILAVGLGNAKMTADALGAQIISQLWMTRALSGQGIQLSGIVPGVRAQTGMETAEIVRGVVEETKPELVLVFDALAACSAHRLCSTVQLTDTGIQPGSGVGNHREGIRKETLGVPVVAVGVPTVIRGAALAGDLVDALAKFLGQQNQTRALANFLSELSDGERHQLMQEILQPSVGNLFVTPKDMDEQVEQIGAVLAEAVNCLVSGVDLDW